MNANQLQVQVMGAVELAIRSGQCSIAEAVGVLEFAKLNLFEFAKKQTEAAKSNIIQAPTLNGIKARS